MPGIELERAADPFTQPVRQRLVAAPRRNRRRRSQDIAKARGNLVVGQQASEDERQRDHAQLRDVGAMIEFRRARRCRRGWQRNPQLFPVTLRRVAQLLQRRTQYVLHDDGTGVRRDDDTFGADGTVRDIARTFVQRGDRRDDLLNQALCRVDVDRDRAPVIRGQKVGKSHAAREPGHHRQGGGGFAEAVDAANRGERIVPETGETARSLPQRKLE